MIIINTLENAPEDDPPNNRECGVMNLHPYCPGIFWNKTHSCLLGNDEMDGWKPDGCFIIYVLETVETPYVYPEDSDVEKRRLFYLHYRLYQLQRVII
jgi:hypothetical protein